MTKEAFIAANRIISTLPIAQIIPLERKVSITKNNFLLNRKKSCYCEDDSEEIIKIPNIYPIYSPEGLSSHGFYSSVPLVYISWLIPSNLLPIIEVIETPIQFTSMIFNKKEKTEIDKHISLFGESFIISSKKILFPLNIEYLYKIRKLVLNKIIEISKKNAIIRLSIFEDLPKILLHDNSSKINEESMIMHAYQNVGSYHTKRCMPLYFNRSLVTYNLHSWVLTKKELNS